MKSMSCLTDRKLILVIPVYNGGEYFKRCLKSVVPVENSFDGIIILINGLHFRKDYMSIVESGLNLTNVKIYFTKKDLSAFQHALHWHDRLDKCDINYDDKILILCHDDELIPENLEKWTAAVRSSAVDELWIGSYIVRRELHTERTVMASVFVRPFKEKMRTLGAYEWILWSSTQSGGYVYTNLSGMVISIIAWRNYMRFSRIFEPAYGGRSEHSYICFKHFKWLKCNEEPVVIINEHALQQGRTGGTFSIAYDEFRWVMWSILNLNYQGLDVTLRVIFYLLKRLIASVGKLLRFKIHSIVANRI